MARLDVVFANPLHQACDRRVRELRRRCRGQRRLPPVAVPISASWHLMLGRYPHQSRFGDCRGNGAQETSSRRCGDFNKINGVLASLLPTVEGQLREMSPTLDPMAGLAHDANRLDERIGNFSMNKARDAAWAFARQLNAMPSGTARALDIAARDTLTAALALKIQEPGPASALLGGADSAAVTAHIRILSRPATSDQAG